MKKAQLKELLMQYGPIEYIWFDHAESDGRAEPRGDDRLVQGVSAGLLHRLQPWRSGGADIRLGEMGRPVRWTTPGRRPVHAGRAEHEPTCWPSSPIPSCRSTRAGRCGFIPCRGTTALPPGREALRDYLGAVKYGNIFSIDVGPDYEGKLRTIDVETLGKVGRMIRGEG